MQTFANKLRMNVNILLLAMTIISCPVSLPCHLEHLTVVGVNSMQQ